ncbi:GNAT family N-acetyltransferase [Spirosoma sp. 209]|uniref:GNAT family N-acetyltransferase n=1 Tax=Spirosoma sp. 209 TaxID=1955701 RepID=UPI001F34369C|nr:GNAT family N-acetyltransferase [Spirosoma sp. 209]
MTTPYPQFYRRHQLDTRAWDACVMASAQRIVYGYSWYLDAVLPGPDWRWDGWVLPGEEGGYRAVLPVPQRRKYGRWVLHQPLFCQLLGLFSADPTVDPTPFYRAVYEQFRYNSGLHVWVGATWPGPTEPIRLLTTHLLDLSAGYETIYSRYNRDRRRNLRRSEEMNWTIARSTDLEPLLRLFRTYHADTIAGGVGDWAYALLGALYDSLRARQLAQLYYAQLDGHIEAGALLVREGNRVIYLFNAASPVGRRGNARTLLIDRVIRYYAGEASPGWFDFESPEKPAIVDFYRSFGAVDTPFQAVRWQRFTWPERLAWRLKQQLLDSKPAPLASRL